jgi:hypothetical protein
MSEQKPKRWPAAVIAGGLALIGLAMMALGAIRLAGAAINLSLVLWLLLPMTGLPLSLWSGYHLYGLLTASYRIDRNGFSLQWGLAAESAPLSRVASVSLHSKQELVGSPSFTLPGFLLGQLVHSSRPIEFFAVRAERLVLVDLGSGQIVISPADPEAFVEAFQSATRMGSLDPLPVLRARSDLLTSRLWRDPAARWLLAGGLLLPLALIGYLSLQAPQLPAQLPFGFEASGAPGPLVPPGRLLLLALVNGLIWVVNLLAGARFYASQRQRALSYSLWGSSLMAGLLFWGAVLQMMAAAR